MGRLVQVGCLALLFAARLAAFEPDIHGPLHRYFERPPTDRFTRRLEEIESGRWAVDRSSELATLRSLLRALEIPESSQMWVFSNTSLQLSLINPGNPRALYFNDELYVGYVPGGRIEVASIDPALGAVFYIFDLPRQAGEGRVKVERATRCMNCHAGEDTGHVPGLSLRSVVPAPSGGSLDALRKGITGHGIPLADRFGGWYVTGADGIPEHWGNKMGRMQGGDVGWTPLPPGERFRTGKYPVETSDLLAHLVHEHQAGFVNRAVRLQYEARELRQGGASIPPAGMEALKPRIDEFVRYVLFADEVPLPEGRVVGDPTFRREFAANRRQVGGESLKDFDLGTRLFRNRCSYLVYSGLFAGLDPQVRAELLAGMSAALRPGGGQGSHLPADEKARLRRILAATVEGWPAD